MLDFLGGDLLDYLIGFSVNHLDDDLIDPLIHGQDNPPVEGEKRPFQRLGLVFDLLA